MGMVKENVRKELINKIIQTKKINNIQGREFLETLSIDKLSQLANDDMSCDENELNSDFFDNEFNLEL